MGSVRAKMAAQPLLLFYTADTKALAEKVAMETDDIETGEIKWEYVGDGLSLMHVSSRALDLYEGERGRRARARRTVCVYVCVNVGTWNLHRSTHRIG